MISETGRILVLDYRKNKLRLNEIALSPKEKVSNFYYDKIFVIFIFANCSQIGSRTQIIVNDF